MDSIQRWGHYEAIAAVGDAIARYANAFFLPWTFVEAKPHVNAPKRHRSLLAESTSTRSSHGSNPNFLEDTRRTQRLNAATIPALSCSATSKFHSRPYPAYFPRDSAKETLGLASDGKSESPAVCVSNAAMETSLKISRTSRQNS